MDSQTLRKARSWWSARQGLASEPSGAPAEALAAFGWARTVGSASPYAALFARTGALPPEIDRMTADGEICELPSVRGCTYLVPNRDFALSLKMAEGKAEAASMATAIKHLGYTYEERDAQSRAVLEALKNGPLDPTQLKTALGGVVRHFGAEGKKRGQSTSLSLSLGHLQVMGEIRRRPLNGRLDNERYGYELWPDNPLRNYTLTPAEALCELADMFWTWSGPASLADFRWFTSCTAVSAKAVAAELGLKDIGAGCLLHERDLEEWDAFKPASTGLPRFLSNLDNLSHLKADCRSLANLGETPPYAFTQKGMASLESHPIYLDGELIGLWEFDPGEGGIVHKAWKGSPNDVAAEAEKLAKVIRDHLGDFRSFSLDSPASRKPRIDLLRS